MLNINSIQKEIIELNELYELKIKAFHLIRDEKYKEAKKILENNSEVFSYFIQFKDGRGLPAIIRFSLGTSWELHYDLHYESVMLQDLRRFKKEIEEKTERYEKLVFIEQQKDFITLQKINLIETEKDRKSSLSFTFILAFGVFVSMIFSLYHLIEDELTLKEIGEIYDLSESRICQIMGETMKKLKKRATTIQHSTIEDFI